MGRHADLIQFYGILSSLEEILGGKRTLAKCDGRIVWPSRGVYFFFEPGRRGLIPELAQELSEWGRTH